MSEANSLVFDQKRAISPRRFKTNKVKWSLKNRQNGAFFAKKPLNFGGIFELFLALRSNLKKIEDFGKIPILGHFQVKILV